MHHEKEEDKIMIAMNNVSHFVVFYRPRKKIAFLKWSVVGLNPTEPYPDYAISENLSILTQSTPLLDDLHPRKYNNSMENQILHPAQSSKELALL